MSRLDKLSPEEKFQLARLASEGIVKHWETIDQRADELQARLGLSREARDKIAADFRDTLGGEELYLAAKEYLSEASPDRHPTDEV